MKTALLYTQPHSALETDGKFNVFIFITYIQLWLMWHWRNKPKISSINKNHWDFHKNHLCPQTFCSGFKTLRVHTYANLMRFCVSTRSCLSWRYQNLATCQKRPRACKKFAADFNLILQQEKSYCLVIKQKFHGFKLALITLTTQSPPPPRDPLSFVLQRLNTFFKNTRSLG